MAIEDREDLDPDVGIEPDVEPQAPTAPVASALEARLVQVLEKLADVQDQGPIKQIPITKANHKTAFNPSGGLRPKLTKKFFMNGYPCNPMRLHNREIELVNTLKPGEYHGKKWIVTQTNLGEGVQQIDLFVPNKTVQDRLDVRSVVGAKGLTGILELIVDEGNRVTAA